MPPRRKMRHKHLGKLTDFSEQNAEEKKKEDGEADDDEDDDNDDLDGETLVSDDILS